MSYPLTSMCGACCNYPKLCIENSTMCCCITYSRRQQQLNNDWNNYICCHGQLCCNCECVKNCPKFCFMFECCCCPGCAVSANNSKMHNDFDLEMYTSDICLRCCSNILQLGKCCCNDCTANICDWVCNECLCDDCTNESCTFPCGEYIRSCSEFFGNTKVRWLSDIFFCCLVCCINTQTEAQYLYFKNVTEY